ncbi:uncharacterized protein LOC110720526 [Chenopodium quinoa]|uniref:Uncharacterized protein n=1 Tax=Chenopodium quinoa TaxID=63459 RepID=A0A803M4Q9_CHEQI|nr:uncharacterized protein LOC110720526 [Chenopodium quinoa]
MKMEEKSSSSVNNDGVKLGIEEAWKWVPSGTHWWWVVASAAQLGWGIKSYKKGFTGDCRFMPARAFGVASLFVGAAATASVCALSAAGIHNVEDMKEAGANIRTGLGVPPRTKAK